MPVCLMYHEIELPGRPMCQSEAGYVRYVVKEFSFRQQLTWLKDHGWHGVSVGQTLAADRIEDIALSFDDGCETDLITAAPLLRQLQYNATFYITVDFLGKRGFLSKAQVRELGDQGFEIGCHSMTHAYLTELDAKALYYELAESKKTLEYITGRSVEHFSCPGGRWNARAVKLAKEAGYRSFATSRMMKNTHATNPFALGRVVVMRSTDEVTFHRLCRGRGLWRMRLQNSTRTAAQHVLGNRLYDELRSRLLG
jgi:peptidoglycan/xylan/chitin deacetylase (PgdA/CDA1 family)